MWHPFRGMSQKTGGCLVRGRLEEGGAEHWLAERKPPLVVSTHMVCGAVRPPTSFNKRLSSCVESGKPSESAEHSCLLCNANAAV